MELNKKLYLYRKAVGLTQEQVANYLKVRQSTVHRWEKGITKPNYDNLVLLSRLYNENLLEM